MKQNSNIYLLKNRFRFLYLHHIRLLTMNHFKFEKIAYSIEEKINQGVLVAGQKLPSVRTACGELAVSPSTVFKAYYELEAKGLIEVKNKSGYYVSLSATQLKKIKQLKEQVTSSKYSITKAKNVDEMIEEMELSKLSDIEVDFSSATPSIQMLPIKKLYKSLQTCILHKKHNLIPYENPVGSIELRKQILLQTIKGSKVNPVDDVIITAGCLEAIGICISILIESGDSILISNSSYYNIISLLKNKDVKIHTYDFNKSSKFNSKNFEKVIIEKQISLCLITSNFHNPTGLTLDTSVKQKIVSIATKNDINIIEDDVYGDLYFEKNKPATLKQFDTKGIVYYCSSFSKTLAPGFRIGYCITGSKSHEFAKQKRLLSLGTNSITQAALIDFMKTGRYDLSLKNLRKQLHLNMLKYGNAILNYFPSEINFEIPKGGYVFWIEFSESFDGYEFYRKVLKEKILITPGEIFSANGCYKNFIRISYSEPYSEKIDYALKQIGNLARKHIVKKTTTNNV